MNWRHCVLLLPRFASQQGLRRRRRVRRRASAKPPSSRMKCVRVAGSATSQINVGDGVLRDETVRTGADSAARLVMADSTNLSLGPNATLKLDRTVFNDEHSYRDIAIRLTTGAFRFVTGHSEKTAYKITTPLATIGVRGTILDILSQRGQTIVVLQEGASRVCTTELPMHRADPARRHRDHHLDRRQGHDHEDQRAALDLCRDLRGSGRALFRQRSLPTPSPTIDAALSMTAASQRSCADADDGKDCSAQLASHRSHSRAALCAGCWPMQRCRRSRPRGIADTLRQRQLRPQRQRRPRPTPSPAPIARRRPRRRRRPARIPAADRSTISPTSASTR